MSSSEIDEIINMNTTNIPYKNVLQNLNVYFKAAQSANEEWKRIIELKNERG